MGYSQADARDAIRHVIDHSDGAPSISDYQEYAREGDPTQRTIYNRYDDAERPWLAAILDAHCQAQTDLDDEFVRELVDNFDRDVVKTELEALGADWRAEWETPPESRYSYSGREMKAAMQRAAAAVGEPLTCEQYMDWRDSQPVELPHRMAYIERYGGWAVAGSRFDIETGTSRKRTADSEDLQDGVEP